MHIHTYVYNTILQLGVRITPALGDLSKPVHGAVPYSFSLHESMDTCSLIYTRFWSLPKIQCLRTACHDDPSEFSFPKQPVFFPTATFSCAFSGGMFYFIVCFRSRCSGQHVLEIRIAKRVGHTTVGKRVPYGILFEFHCGCLTCEVFFFCFTPKRVRFRVWVSRSRAARCHMTSWLLNLSLPCAWAWPQGVPGWGRGEEGERQHPPTRTCSSFLQQLFIELLLCEGRSTSLL